MSDEGLSGKRMKGKVKTVSDFKNHVYRVSVKNYTLSKGKESVSLLIERSHSIDFLLFISTLHLVVIRLLGFPYDLRVT